MNVSSHGAKLIATSDQQTVLTPEGPRLIENVHLVEPGKIIETNAEGRTVITSINGSPDEMVLTPEGPRPRSRVHMIMPDQSLRVENGNILLIGKSGEIVANFGSSGEEKVLKPQNNDTSGFVPLGTGWITYAWWQKPAGNPITSFATTWTVPPAPKTNGGTIFLFNGIQNNVPYIFQPVLQYGQSAAGGGDYWSVASWYVGGSDAFHTPLVNVVEGQKLVGVMERTSGTGFSYQSYFEGIAGTTLPVTNIPELTWCIETLEAYDVTTCDNYPATGSTAFRDIDIDIAATQPTLTWTPANSVTDCGQFTEVISNANPGGEVLLHYSNGWNKLGGYITSSPSVILDNQGKTEVWVRGGDNSLWVNIDGSWQGKGGILASDPFAAKDYNGKIHVLVRGSDNAAWDFIYNPQTSAGQWKYLGGIIKDGPTAAMEPASHAIMKVAARGNDNALWYCDLYINTGATQWYTVGGVLASAPYVIFDPSGVEHAFVRGGDNALWDNRGAIGLDGQYHFTWNGLGGSLSSKPTACIEPGFTNYVAAFAKGSDNALWFTDVYSAAQPETSIWYRLGGIISSDPFVVAETSTNRIHTFVRAGDYALWENIFSTLPWNPNGCQWHSLGGALLSYACGGTIGSDTKAYAIGAEHALWRNTHDVYSALSAEERIIPEILKHDMQA